MQGGQFCFKGKVEEPFQADISIAKRENGFAAKMFNVFVENSNIRIDGDWENLCGAKITGSALQDQYEAFNQQLDTLYEERGKLDAQMYTTYTGYLYEGGFTEACIAPGIKLEKQMKALNKRIEQYRIDFICQHPSSPVSLEVCNGLVTKGHSEEELVEVLGMLAPELQMTDAYRQLQAKVKEVTRFAPGKDFVDFKVVDVNGKEGMFSDYVKPGKYNMLEVWASWCGHCRVEIPHLKMVQEKYGDRFNIIAVSWDKDEAEWRKAMKEENAPYLQLRAVKDENGQDVGTAYGLHGIPFSLVIDGEGKIVTEEARAASLDLLLEKLYEE